MSSLQHINSCLALKTKETIWYNGANIKHFASFESCVGFLLLIHGGAVCCYDLTIAACEEATGKTVTSDSLSANSLACPRNVFLRIIHSPWIGMSAKRLVHELAHLRIAVSTKSCVHKLSCLRIVCPRIGMSAKSPVLTGRPTLTSSNWHVWAAS